MEKMRKLAGILLCAALLLCLALPVMAREKADVTISNTEEFLSFAQSCRLDSYSMDLTVSLEADIDLKNTDFAGIPIFCGTFLGNGHTISGLDISGNGSQQGLFRYLTQTAVVKDLNVSGSVKPQGSRSCVGSIVGSNAGSIKNCTFTGEVSGSSQIGGIAGHNEVSGVIRDCTVSGSISGGHFVGGIAGVNAGVIRMCENLANVNDTSQENRVDISDITIGTITGTESANTVTDIGGIAGSSSGTIRGCKNKGNIGYVHMGYNIGGIVGSQTGYVANCENFGTVSGRKEVGGIVGQMEPSVLVSYETDTLQLLRAQMTILGELTDQAASNAQTNSAAIRSLVAALEKHVANAEEAIDVLTIDPENPQIQDLDTYIAAVQTLGSSITGIDNTVRSLYQAVKVTGDDLESDLMAISDQIDVINGILNSAEDNLGGTMTDASDADTEEDLTSKIERCKNHALIQGDRNVGGIAGAIALENDLDPEEDVKISGEATLNAAATLRSVILDSKNFGDVSVRKQNCGGIAGWQSMGLIKGCVNTGAMDGGDYTGGISGQSYGYIRSSYTKGAISGDTYVGGIAGSGTVVTDCRSMVKLYGSERLGAVLGFAEKNHTEIQNPISSNVYACVDGDPGGVDGISYAYAAQPMELEDFLALSDLPKQFLSVTVSFVFEDGTVKKVELTPGTGLTEEQIPQLPAMDGYSGKWDGLETTSLECILSDLTIQAVYAKHDSVLGSSETVNNKPVLLIIGDFVPGASLILEESESEPDIKENAKILNSLSFSVPGSQDVSGARYLLSQPEDPDALQVYVHNSDGSWRVVSHTLDGSYLVFALEAGDDGIAIAQEQRVQIPWLIIAAGAGLLLVVAIIVVRVSQKPKTANVEEDQEDLVK